MSRIKVVQHEIGNNIAVSTKQGESTKYTVIRGIDKIAVGVPTGNTTIAVDKNTGLKYETAEVVGKVIYSFPEQIHSAWFALDLETGKRGWYPGCIVWGVVPGADIEIFSSEDAPAEVLTKITNTRVQILTKLDGLVHQYYNIRYNDIVGYIKVSDISTIIYKDPE